MYSEDLFIRKPTAKEKTSGTARTRGMIGIPAKESYETVYKPYGNSGNSQDAGYYYRNTENS